MPSVGSPRQRQGAGIPPLWVKTPLGEGENEVDSRGPAPIGPWARDAHLQKKKPGRDRRSGWAWAAAQNWEPRGCTAAGQRCTWPACYISSGLQRVLLPTFYRVSNPARWLAYSRCSVVFSVVRMRRLRLRADLGRTSSRIQMGPALDLRNT